MRQLSGTYLEQEEGRLLRPSSSIDRACWSLIILWAAALAVSSTVPQLVPMMLGLQLLFLFLFTLLHGAARYGFVGMSIFLAIALITSNVFENLSIETGFPFGRFHHTPAMGPKLFHVPLVVGFVYANTGYLAWSLANLLLGEPDRERSLIARVGLPLVAMFIITGSDASIDPIASTVQGRWVFEQPGGYFGVPLSNFAGWLLMSYLFFQLFSLYLARRTQPVTLRQRRSWWAQPAIMFAVIALQPSLNLLSLPDIVVTDPGGTAWRSHHVYETTLIVSLCTMVFVSVTGLLLALRRPQPVV